MSVMDVMRHYAEGLGKELDGAPEYPFPFSKEGIRTF